MLERFLEHVRNSGLIPPGRAVLVGYSGGPDSTCLLHVLLQGKFSIVAAHLHHGQRAEADEELRRCREFCEGLGVSFFPGHADVPRMSEELKVSVEEAGRLARYEFFERAAVSAGCDLIATAHTRDDLIETVLLHLVRGTGIAGLEGIPERRGAIVRPLLPFTRQETAQYCQQHSFWTHDDPANTELRHSRARIRSLVVPELEAINPDLHKSITRLAKIAKEESQFLDGMAAAALEKCEIPINGRLAFLTQDIEIAFDRELLCHLPEVLLKRALRLAAAAVGGSLDFHQVGIAAEGVRAGNKGSVTGENEAATLAWTGERLEVFGRQEAPHFRHPLTVPGETISDEFGWVLTADRVRIGKIDLRRHDLETYMNNGALKGDLFFRNWRPSDEMRPLGFGRRRKLADLMAESGLTVRARRRLPIVCDMIGPVWAPGVCLDERVQPGSEDKEALLLKFGQVPLGPPIDRNGVSEISVR